MKRLVAVVIVAGALATGAASASAEVKVVATTEDLAAITQEVGGDKVNVEALARGYQDPHFVEAKPSFILKLHSTQLLVAVGRELEIGWLPPLIVQSRNAAIQPGGRGYLDASLTVRILDIPTGQVTRAMGDVHPQGNPHYWLDPGERPAHRAGRAAEAVGAEPRGRGVLRAAICRFRQAARGGGETVGRRHGSRTRARRS